MSVVCLDTWCWLSLVSPAVLEWEGCGLGHSLLVQRAVSVPFAFKLIRVTQPELIQTQKSQEPQPAEEAKPASSKTVTPENTHPGRALYQQCCQPGLPWGEHRVVTAAG